MLLHILHGTSFEVTALIEEYQSCVWTERFIGPGDFRLVLPATHKNAVRLRPKNIILCDESDEPMLVESRDIQDGMITATGKTLEAFFKERWVSKGLYAGSPGDILRALFQNMQTRWGGRYAMTGVRVGDPVDGVAVIENIENNGPAHEAMLQIAQKRVVGMRVIRARKADLSGYEMVFVPRVGVDRSDRVDHPEDFIRFSPNDDSLVNVRELFTSVDEVDVVIVVPPTWTTAPGIFGETLVPKMYPPAPADRGDGLVNVWFYEPFKWQAREIDSEEMTEEWLADFAAEDPHTSTWPAWADMSDSEKRAVVNFALDYKAQDEWSKVFGFRKIAIDGEVPPNAFRFGQDYHLGDLVQVEGNFTGGARKAQVTEYTRSADATGKRSWPTLAQPLAPYTGAEIDYNPQSSTANGQGDYS